MSTFKNALEIVHDALRGMHANGSNLRASRGSLERLRSTPPAEPEAPLIAATLAPQPGPPPPPAPAPTVAPERTPSADGRSNAEQLAEIRPGILACMKCLHLASSRTQVVFGVGNPDAELMFVGEAPGEDEDRQGEPFVGRAGELLTKIIVAMGFARGDVYIANVLKCRPDVPPGVSGNRKPKAEEMQTCLPYLRKQIEIIRPRVLVALGATAMEGLTGDTSAMARMRGRWHEFQGIPLMATYHPAYLLRNQSNTEKRKVWEDMLLVLEKLGRPISEKQRNYFLPRAG
jgi:DNA polymerase